MNGTTKPRRTFQKRSKTAADLGVGLDKIRQYENAKLLTVFRFGKRNVNHDTAEVARLAEQLARQHANAPLTVPVPPPCPGTRRDCGGGYVSKSKPNSRGD